MVWGVQDFIFLSDIPAMVDRDSQLTIRLEVLDASVLATNPTGEAAVAAVGIEVGALWLKLSGRARHVRTLALVPCMVPRHKWPPPQWRQAGRCWGSTVART